MKNIDYYSEIGLPYPSENNFVSYQVNNVLAGTVFLKDVTKKQLEEEGFKAVSKIEESNIQKKDGVEYIVVYRFNESAYKQAKKDYQEKANALNSEFQDDLAREYGYTPNSEIANLVYDKAWDRGHSAGLHEVASYYSDYSDFADRITEIAKEA